MSIEVAVRDTESGETQTATIEDDYVLITAGTCYVAALNDFPTTGTRQITIKGRRS